MGNIDSPDLRCYCCCCCSCWAFDLQRSYGDISSTLCGKDLWPDPGSARWLSWKEQEDIFSSTVDKRVLCSSKDLGWGGISDGKCFLPRDLFVDCIILVLYVASGDFWTVRHLHFLNVMLPGFDSLSNIDMHCQTCDINLFSIELHKFFLLFLIFLALQRTSLKGQSIRSFWWVWKNRWMHEG